MEVQGNKKEVFFKIIIPNYNNAEWLPKCLDSVYNQTFNDYYVVIVDDVSTDNSLEIMNNYASRYSDKTTIIPLAELGGKRYNGGSRNIGIQYPSDIKSKYTLFIDSDDWFANNEIFQKIYNIIESHNYPDCVSLSYNCYIGNNASFQKMDRNTPQDLVKSLYVACWTKCIKTDLIVLFPENTLMEDVVQHIAQCDKLNTITSFLEPAIYWNRNNLNSCSRVENQNLQQGKWQSSMYRYAADLMDLKCKHDYCEEHRKWRLGIALNNIKDGKYIQ